MVRKTLFRTTVIGAKAIPIRERLGSTLNTVKDRWIVIANKQNESVDGKLHQE